MIDRLSPGIWIDKHGNLHRISYMDTKHLKNVLNLLQKWRKLAVEHDAILFIWLLDRKIDEIEDELIKRDEL